ncbi:MAG: methyltransferase domain-containing protein [Methylococcaceae bacterium]|jgi:2-polyprenyl-3-methyl-5-hydroxy-6-metoxy-1,4-benzoquinol methylase
MSKIAFEPQNQIQFDTYNERGGVILGPYSSHIYRSDPRHLSFLLARYKFISKMLQGKKKVLEIGCGDSFGTALILQTVESVHAIDIEPLVIADNIKRTEHGGGRCSYEVLDITSNIPKETFDGAFALDVIEHIPPEREKYFMKNIFSSLNEDAMLLIGTPNITAKQYASPGSAEGHINLKSENSLRNLMSEYFRNVFIFSMNDEVVHTGYSPMAHYLIGMGVGKINTTI